MELVVLIAVPAVVAFALALLVGRRAYGGAAVTAVGAAIAAALLVWMFASADTEPNCSDCEEWFGRWVSPIFATFVLLGLLGWILGVVAATAVRRTRPPAD